MSNVYGDKIVLGDDVLEAAKDRIRYCFESGDRVVVCFSGGKDSTALLNTALIAAEEMKRLPLDVFFVDEECIYPETEAYCERVAADPRINFTWSCVPVKHWNACSRKQPYYLTFDPAEREHWVRTPPECAVTHESRPDIPFGATPDQIGYFFPPSMGTVVQMLGRRSQESLTRWRMVYNRGGSESFISRANMAEWKHIRTADPIYDWQTEDVWTAPLLYGWDHNTAYAKLSKMGISLSMQRVAPPFGEEPAATLWTWKIGWPDLWDRMSTRVPGANTTVRLYNTPLYMAKPKDLEPNPGESWQEYVTRLIYRWPPDMQPTIAKNVAFAIRHHNSTTKRMTGEATPLPESKADERSGVSWQVVARIAFKGLMKTRTLSQVLGSTKTGTQNTVELVEDAGFDTEDTQ